MCLCNRGCMGDTGVACEGEQESKKSSIAVIKAVGSELQSSVCF